MNGYFREDIKCIIFLTNMQAGCNRENFDGGGGGGRDFFRAPGGMVLQGRSVEVHAHDIVLDRHDQIT